MQTVVRLLMDAEFSVKFYVSRPANDNFAIRQRRIKAEDIISYKSRLPVGWEFRDVFSAIVNDHPLVKD
ncbi:MAG: hypothetical protein RL223_4532 [Pseudomonadota bacterium]